MGWAAWEWLFPLLAMLASLALHRRESGLRPGPLRPRAADLIFAGLFGAVFLFLLALTGRPLVAGAVPLVLSTLLMLLNRAKLAVLAEPLVFADVYMVRQLIFFPKFYFPYIPARPFILGALVLILLALGTHFAGYSPSAVSVGVRLAALGILALAGWLALGPGARGRWMKVLEKSPLSFEPELDGRRYGLVGAAFLQAIWQSLRGEAVTRAAAPDEKGLAMGRAWPEAAARPPAPPAPHIILVQAESFFHLRRLIPNLAADWTANFDRLAGEGLAGLLQIDSYGAYTIRTEFSVLTGLGGASLKSRRFNPYGLAARFDVGGLPRRLAGLGYETMCLHPSSPKFLDRDRVMPRLGFQRFLDERDFAGAERYGPYVADAAIAERLAGELSGGGPAKFAFVITIEAHGPWLPGRLTGRPWPAGASALPPFMLKDGPDGGLAAYARHLRRADEFLGRLAGLAAGLDRPLILGWYGDHLGSLPPGLAPTGGRATDFLIWGPGRARPRHRGIATPVQPPRPGSFGGSDLEASYKPLPPERLGGLLLEAAGRREA